MRTIRFLVLAGLLLAALGFTPAVALADEPEEKRRVVVKPGREGTVDLQDIVKSAKTTTKPAKPTTQQVEQALAKVKSLKDARKLYMAGKYDVAVKGYRKLASQKDLQVSAAIGLADAYAIQGEYPKAIQALEEVSGQGENRADWQLAMARASEHVGRYEQALAHAVQANTMRSDWAPAILVRGRLLETMGRKTDAAAVYKTIDRTLENEEYRKDAPSLVALGKILDRYAILTGQRASRQSQNILHNYLQEAYLKADKGYWPAHVASGMFLLSKHRIDSARKEFGSAYKLNKRIPDIFIGAAYAELAKWQFEKSLKHAEKALEINPNSVDGHLLKAMCLMKWRKFDAVRPHIDEALKVNPNHPEALSLMAALKIRQNKDSEAEQYAERLKKINPKPAVLPLTIAQWLVAGRQFDQAEGFYKQAIRWAPELADAHAGLGLMYMQTGDEAEAMKVLTKAHEIDDFRSDVVNYLNLLDRMAKRFKVKETENFIVKVDRKYDEVLLNLVSEYMESIHEEICLTHDYFPRKKTIVEIFPTQTQFSLRISGRGWVPTVGASTGRVIALTAPRSQNPLGTHNWAVVLKHEYTHTVTLAATNNNIPHWLTEAFAVWQQPDKRSYRYVTLLVSAAKNERLFPIDELDWGFIRPKRPTDRPLAYAQSELTMEYIIDTRGFMTVIDMLKAFRDGKTQEEVFRTVLKTDEKQFDKDFRTWARAEMRDWGFNPDPKLDIGKAKKAVKENPKSADAKAKLAVAYRQHGGKYAAQAEKLAREALKIDPDQPDALMVVANALAGKKQWDQAIEQAKKLEAVDPSTYQAPKILAVAYMAKRDTANAIHALELLKQRQPLEQFPYEHLARIYIELGQPAKALPNLEHLHTHTMKDAKYARQAAEIYRGLGEDDKALHFFKQVLQINPYETNIYRSIASLLLQAQQYAKAVDYAKALCTLEPESSKSWVSLAVVQFRAGRANKDADMLVNARKSAQKALEIDSDDAQAKRVIQMIDASL
ncbi:MAG: tetratricopeptide repeat protein [Phycisphaerae bacterium]